MSAALDLAEIKAAAERAAPGPWQQGPQDAVNPAAILALIARLESAERERDALRNIHANDMHDIALLRMARDDEHARAERLAAVLEAEREERRAERAVWEAGDALERAEARDDELAYAQAVKQHDAALQAYDLVHERAEAARAALAAERTTQGTDDA